MKSFRVFLAALFVSLCLHAQEPWLKPAFSSSPAELSAAAAKAEAKDSDVIVLFDDSRIRFDDEGRATRTYYMVYKVLSPEGVESWSTIVARYEPWRENKPVLRARVITADGKVHTLDPKTLTDAPVNTDSPRSSLTTVNCTGRFPPSLPAPSLNRKSPSLSRSPC